MGVLYQDSVKYLPNISVKNIQTFAVNKGLMLWGLLMVATKRGE